MHRKLLDCRVLITGASGGIGRALAFELSRQRARIVLMARRHDALEKTVERVHQLGGQAVSVVGDVGLADDRRRAVDACVSHFQGLDVLINNAGVGAIGRFSESEPERLQRIMEVNFFGPVELTRLCLPYLRQSRGAVVNVSSVLGHRAVPNKSEYCASKFALHGFSDALRAEVASDGIGVTLVSPSTVDSDFFDHVIEGKPHSRRKGICPSKVARMAIRAVQRRKAEVILPLEGKALVLLDRLWPSLANRLVEARSDKQT